MKFMSPATHDHGKGRKALLACHSAPQKWTASEARGDCQPVCISFLSQSDVFKQSDADHPCSSNAQHRFLNHHEAASCLSPTCKTAVRNCRAHVIIPSSLPSFLPLCIHRPFIHSSIHYIFCLVDEAQTVLSSPWYELLSKQLAHQQHHVLPPKL